MKSFESNNTITEAGFKILDIETPFEEEGVVRLTKLEDFLECGKHASQPIMFSHIRYLGEEDFIWERGGPGDDISDKMDEILDEDNGDIDDIDLTLYNKALNPLKRHIGDPIVVDYYLFFAGILAAFRDTIDWYKEFEIQKHEALGRFFQSASERARQRSNATLLERESKDKKITQIKQDIDRLTQNDDFRKLVLKKNTTIGTIKQYILKAVPAAAELSGPDLKSITQDIRDKVYAGRAFAK